jgi:hypothetical protein
MKIRVRQSGCRATAFRNAAAIQMSRLTKPPVAMCSVRGDIGQPRMSAASKCTGWSGWAAFHRYTER